MSEKRRRRVTEQRLDRMARVADGLDEEEETAGSCPKCQGKMVGRKVEIEPQGTVKTLRCIQCGYVFMQRS